MISPKQVEGIFKAWQKADFSPEEISRLSFLNEENTLSLDAKRLQLRDALYEQILAEVTPTFRNTIESGQRTKLVEALKITFQSDSTMEQAFALIYCRYLSPRKYSVKELADQIGISTRTLRRNLVTGFKTLALQFQMKQQKSDLFQSEELIAAYFPTPETDQVIGLKPSILQISGWLSSNAHPFAVSIEGIGGIGKTVLAKHLLRHIHESNYFDGYVWISARQDKLSASGEIAPINDFVSTLDDITARLTYELGQKQLAGLPTQDKLSGLKAITDKKRFLIIIDNLETVEDVDTLVPELLKLTGYSKILYTSRKSMSQYTAVRTFSVPELSLENSHLLVLSEMQRSGLPLTISDKTMTDLYQVSGGVPLALKLAAGQFGLYPANEIIENLRFGKNNSQNLYIYIYRKAWQLLDDIARRLLLSMLLVSPDGEERQWICETGDLSAKEFAAGLEQLKRLSLIEFSGTSEVPLYRIHRLTSTFLHTDIIKSWPDEVSS